MTTTPNGNSFRVPTAADLRAFGCPPRDSELLSPLLGAFHHRGWSSPQELREVVDRSKKTVLAVLTAAQKLRLVTKRPVSEGEHLWNLGEAAGIVPEYRPDLLAENALPTAADYWANGFTAAPGMMAARVIQTLNACGGELAGELLAKSVGTTWANLGYTLRPLESLGQVSRRRLHQVCPLKRGNRRHAVRGHDVIVLNASAVRSMPRSTSNHCSSKIADALRITLDRVDWPRVRCGPRVRRLIEVLAPSRLITWEQLGIEVGCEFSGLYGSQKYPGPVNILKRLRILSTQRVGKRLEWFINEALISSKLPQISGDAPSPVAEVRRRPRFGQLQRLWDQLDPEMLSWACAFDHAKKGSLASRETATAYINLAAAIGGQFRGTYAELTQRFGAGGPHEVTVGKYARMAAADGFIKIEPLTGPGGIAGNTLAVNRWRFRDCAREPLDHADNVPTTRPLANLEVTSRLNAEGSPAELTFDPKTGRPLVYGKPLAEKPSAAGLRLLRVLADSLVPLTKDELDIAADCSGAPTVLRRLVTKHPELTPIISFPGQGKGGYCLESRRPVNQK